MATTSPRSRIGRRVSIAAIAVVAGGLLAGCSAVAGLLPSGPAERDPNTKALTVAGTESPFSIRVGDCFNDESGREIDEVPAVPCSEPHEFEAFHAFAIGDGSYPGDDAITAQGEVNCEAGFAMFTGISFDDSELSFAYLHPTERSWANGDRTVVCAISDGEDSTGSLQGAAR